jgi:pyruvate dehydrogenase E2 component (dihydrolipoamide acetyltransferase)
MAVDVIMPKVDMDQETGTVLQWLKKEGEKVEQGETILEIETDKVAIEVEAPASGILSGILVREGDTVPIATVIARILEAGDTNSPRLGSQGVRATPVARKLAEAAGIDVAGITGTGRGGKVTRQDVQAEWQSGSVAGGKLQVAGGKSEIRYPKSEIGKVCATPAARRLAREQGVELASLRGSGPNGRVQAGDVRTALETQLQSPQRAAPYEAIPLRGKRRAIAERMTASYQNAPHITFTARVDMSGFEEARARLNARIVEGAARISATALLVKIVAQTRARHPWLNSALQDEEIRLYRDVHIGVAVALEDGLIVPVVRDADKKGVAQIAAEVRDLSTRAREGKLAQVEVREGTFTISNLGPFGVEQFTAIINPPQAAILALGAIQPEAVPDSEGHVVVRPIMRITLSADHRVIDGAVAARFIADLKAALEAPVLLLL